MKKNSATTLIEILIAMTVFVLIMVVVMGGFTLVYSNWKKQKEYVDLVSKAQRAMSFMTAELKYARDPGVQAGGDWLNFKNATGTEYWYWRGSGVESSILYRAQGTNHHDATLNNPRELVTSIVDNPGTSPTNFIFGEDPSGCVRIKLTLSSGNYNYSLASGACCRNQLP